MPVILPPERYEEWLDPGNKDVEGLLRLLVPFDARKMTGYPVSKVVNRAGVDSPECVQPVG